jgi:parvulin-like peptidyl-prolyl isomerase
MIDGNQVAAEALWPALAEASGATVLREAALDRALSLELQKRRITVTAADTEAERSLLLDSLSAERESAARLLEALRRREGLGPNRFAALLERNAALRALVRDQVQITDEALRTAWDMLSGPRRQVRIMSLGSLPEADRAAAAVRGGQSFIDVAVERSVDQSAARGGLLEPFARSDPSYPESLRQAAFSLQPGQLSSPILLPQGYVICTLVGERPGSGQSFDAMRPQLERSVRLSQERLLMDQLARRLLRETRVTVFDDSLNWSWSAREQ